MEKAGWTILLQSPWFVQQLQGVTLFVASHHGGENGYCEEVLFTRLRLVDVVIGFPLEARMIGPQDMDSNHRPDS